MNINGRYIRKEQIIGYHWYRSTCLYRLYFIIDLVNGSSITILNKYFNGEVVNDVSKIIEFIES